MIEVVVTSLSSTAIFTLFARALMRTFWSRTQSQAAKYSPTWSSVKFVALTVLTIFRLFAVPYNHQGICGGPAQGGLDHVLPNRNVKHAVSRPAHPWF
jgi:formate hydrogenlyase subunit 3/multisubunit Na+/H+ antiporter MnhD subunit